MLLFDGRVGLDNLPHNLGSIEKRSKTSLVLTEEAGEVFVCSPLLVTWFDFWSYD